MARRSLTGLCALLALALACALRGAQAAFDVTKTEAVIGETLMAGFGMWITIFPKEDTGEPYEGPLLPFEATFISSEGDVTVADSDEQYVISALFTVATNYTVEITQGGQPIGNSPLEFIIQPGDVSVQMTDKPDPLYLTQLNTGIANNINLRFKDEFGNPVEVEHDRISITANYLVADPPPKEVVVTWGPAANELNVDIFVNKTGSFSIKITLDSEPDNPFVSVSATIVPGVFEPSVSYADVGALAVTEPPFPEVFSTARTLTIYATDLYGNSLRPSAVNPVDAAIFTCEFALVETVNDAEPGVISTHNSTLNGDTFASSTGYNCTYGPSTVSGNYTLSVLYNDQHIAGSPYKIYLQPGDMDGPTSYITGVGDDVKQVGQNYSFLIVSRDVYGNRLTSGGNLDFLVAQVSSVGSANPYLIVALVEDLNDGTYNCTFTMARSGQFLVSAFYFFYLIGGSSYITAFAPTSASHSLVYGNGVSSCQAGVTCRFVVETRDQFDLPVAGDDEILVTIDGSQVGTIRHDADHFYVVEYSINGPGFRELAVKVNGQHAAASPYSLYVSPSDTAIGVIVAVVLLTVAAACIIGYIVYQRRQIKKKRQEWARKKAAAYKEYQLDGSVPIPLAAQKDDKEPEWEDKPEDDRWDENMLPTDPAEWEAMQKWLHNKNVPVESVPSELFHDDIEMLNMASKS